MQKFFLNKEDEKKDNKKKKKTDGVNAMDEVFFVLRQSCYSKCYTDTNEYQHSAAAHKIVLHKHRFFI